MVWKLDRLGRTLTHLVNTLRDLSDRGVGLRVLTGQGTEMDTTTSAGGMIFGIFAALAEFERDLIRERTLAGLDAARARGRKGGRKFALTKARVRLAQAAMANRDTSVSALAAEIGIKPVTLYRGVDANGNLREHGKRVLAAWRRILHSPESGPYLIGWVAAAFVAGLIVQSWRAPIGIAAFAGALISGIPVHYAFGIPAGTSSRCTSVRR